MVDSTEAATDDDGARRRDTVGEGHRASHVLKIVGRQQEHHLVNRVEIRPLVHEHIRFRRVDWFGKFLDHIAASTWWAR